MNGPVVASFVGILVIAFLHIASPLHDRWSSHPRFWVLTFASGAAVGFVLTRLVPEVVGNVDQIRGLTGLGRSGGVRFELTLMLASVVAFFGMDRLVKHSLRHESEEGRSSTAGPGAFAAALTIYSVMNLGVGYLILLQADRGYAPVVLLVVAKGFAFLVLDHAYLEDQGEKYGRFGRWVVAIADLAGWGLAFLVRFPPVVPTLFLTVLGGGILLNTLKEETPPGREARWWPFAGGAAGYATLAWVLG